MILTNMIGPNMKIIPMHEVYTSNCRNMYGHETCKRSSFHGHYAANIAALSLLCRHNTYMVAAMSAAMSAPGVVLFWTDFIDFHFVPLCDKLTCIN